jgi:hypothetical protein
MLSGLSGSYQCYHFHYEESIIAAMNLICQCSFNFAYELLEQEANMSTADPLKLMPWMHEGTQFISS